MHVQCFSHALFQPHPSVSNMDERPELKELQERVRTVKWHALGIQLDLENSTLEEIATQYANNVENCRRTMFSTWLSTMPSHKCTRRELLKALRSRDVAENYTAEEYERSFQERTHSVAGMYR